jgi:hypothetical protein
MQIGVDGFWLGSNNCDRLATGEACIRSPGFSHGIRSCARSPLIHDLTI